MSLMGFYQRQYREGWWLYFDPHSTNIGLCPDCSDASFCHWLLGFTSVESLSESHAIFSLLSISTVWFQCSLDLSVHQARGAGESITSNISLPFVVSYQCPACESMWIPFVIILWIACTLGTLFPWALHRLMTLEIDISPCIMWLLSVNQRLSFGLQLPNPC